MSLHEQKKRYRYFLTYEIFFSKMKSRPTFEYIEMYCEHFPIGKFIFGVQKDFTSQMFHFRLCMLNFESNNHSPEFLLTRISLKIPAQSANTSFLIDNTELEMCLRCTDTTSLSHISSNAKLACQYE